MAARFAHDSPAASAIEFGTSVVLTIHENSRSLGPHRNVVFQPWTAQPVQLQPIYDETVTSSAFFPTAHQMHTVDETVAKPYPKFEEKHPRNASDTDAVLMSNIVSKEDPNIPINFVTAPNMQMLRRCETVLEFLKAIYDLLEGHRFLAKYAGILMRNVNFSTVRRGPIPEGWHQQYNGVYRPKLANETLDYEKAEGERNRLESVGLRMADVLRDGVGFYQATAVTRKRIKYLLDRPGDDRATISRGVSRGYFLAPLPRPCPMPKFRNPRALAAYHAMHDSSDPARFTYTHAYDPRALKDVPNLSEERCTQQPRHDVESAYWMIVVHILRSVPLVSKTPAAGEQPPLDDDANTEADSSQGDSENISKPVRPPEIKWTFSSFANNDSYIESLATAIEDENLAPDEPAHLERLAYFNKLLEGHHIPSQPSKDAPADERDAFFTELKTAEQWADVLHPGMKSLAPMMARLTELVAPEYEYLSIARENAGKIPIGLGGGELPIDHLHEGVQRILLDQIFDMVDAQAAGDENAAIRTDPLMERGDKNLKDARDREIHRRTSYVTDAMESDNRKPYHNNMPRVYHEVLGAEEAMAVLREDANMETEEEVRVQAPAVEMEGVEPAPLNGDGPRDSKETKPSGVQESTTENERKPNHDTMNVD